MSNNKQQPQPENPNNQFSNTEPLTHAQRVAIANQIHDKQSMKLYTEEDLTIAIGLARHGDQHWSVDEIVKDFTPIELPSDEGIKKIMELDDMEFDEFDPYHVSHLDGAKWMRDKIQGGNNEQQ